MPQLFAKVYCVVGLHLLRRNFCTIGKLGLFYGRKVTRAYPIATPYKPSRSTDGNDPPWGVLKCHDPSADRCLRSSRAAI